MRITYARNRISDALGQTRQAFRDRRFFTFNIRAALRILGFKIPLSIAVALVAAFGITAPVHAEECLINSMPSMYVWFDLGIDKDNGDLPQWIIELWKNETIDTYGECPTSQDKRESAATHYTIQRGDLSLWEVSQRLGIPFGSLLDANSSMENPNLIRIGDMIRLP